MEHMVLTVIAKDQPGLVERVAQCVADHGGNWLESRMSRLAGQFAGILCVAVSAEHRAELVGALQALDAQGIRVLCDDGGSEPAGSWTPILLDLMGNDRPGIIRDITRLLAEQGVSLQSLSTEVTPAPMSGELLFHAEAVLAVPQELALENLQGSLETLADELMVELNLRAED